MTRRWQQVLVGVPALSIGGLLLYHALKSSVPESLTLEKSIPSSITPSEGPEVKSTDPLPPPTSATLKKWSNADSRTTWKQLKKNLETNKVEQAIGLLEQFVQYSSDDRSVAEAFVQIARAHLDAGSYWAAVAPLEQALALEALSSKRQFAAHMDLLRAYAGDFNEDGVRQLLRTIQERF